MNGLNELAWVLAEIESRGLDPVLEELGDGHRHLRLVQEWLATKNWTESQDFLTANPGLISDPRTTEVLWAGSDPAIVQHIAIVRLCQRMHIDEAYDLVTDVTMAVDAAMTAVESGDPSTLAYVWAAAPALAREPFAAPYLTAVHWMLTDTGDNPSAPADETIDPVHLIKAAAENGTATQRAAGAARLRRLAHNQPEHTETLTHLANILTTDPHGTTTEATTTNTTAGHDA